MGDYAVVLFAFCRPSLENLEYRNDTEEGRTGKELLLLPDSSTNDHGCRCSFGQEKNPFHLIPMKLCVLR